MLRTSDITTYLTSYLSDISPYDSTPPTILRGPADQQALDRAFGRIVVVTMAGGAGLSTEYVFDRPGVQLRCVGDQGDPDGEDAEILAQYCDKAMLMFDHSQYLGAKWVTSIVRMGGGPQVLERDSADRVHYTCGYIVEVEADLDD